MKKVLIIGSGFGGLAAAAIFAKAGYSVEVFEKNEQVGGRASVLHAKGFTYDMGPSWYLMPDIFENFFHALGERVSDHLQLQRLSPSYRIHFKDTGHEPVDFYGDLARDLPTLEKLEPGVTPRFMEYLRRSEEQYRIAADRFLYKNYDSLRDFFTPELMRDGIKLAVWQSMAKYAAKYFRTEEVRKVVQYPLVFLGTSPYDAPALYSLMTHVDFGMGVFYPQGGIGTVVQAIHRIATKHGAVFHLNAPVARIVTQGGKATGIVLADGTKHSADIVITNADPQFTDQTLLDASTRVHSDRYWQRRTLAPSAFCAYLGYGERVPNAVHHTLVFSKDWQTNFNQIFRTPQWPTDPSLYLSTPSVTDPTVAPAGMENMFLLVPIAPGLLSTDADRRRFADTQYGTLRKTLGFDPRDHLVHESFFSTEEFAARYHSPQGTALGLAHTLLQTALWRPNTVHPQVHNLYYVGGSVNPGIGMPMCLISAELVYKRVIGDTSPHHLSSIPRA